MTAVIVPFRPLRFQLGPEADVGAVWAPPYDVITAGDAATLRERHTHNIVRITNPTDGREDRYATAARELGSWIDDGALVRESQPAVYVHQHTFESAGNSYRRTGFWALVRLDEFGAGGVVPHERTLEGPKADRLALMRACRAQLSPVFFISSDPDGSLLALMEGAAKGEPHEEAEFPTGMRHRIWRVVDQPYLNRLLSAAREQVLLIADGHHRYETALKYRDELVAAGAAQTGRGPHECLLAYIVPEDDPGLLLLPTHRLMHGDPLPWVSAVLKTSDRFDVSRLSGAEVESAVAALGGESGRPSFVLVARDEDGGWLLRLRKPTSTTAISSVALHEVFLAEGAGLSVAQQVERVSYVKDASEALESVRTGTAQAAFILSAPEVGQVRAAAAAGERLPPKTTYFWPKVPTGIAIHSIDPSETLDFAAEAG
ncbi:MAG: DUF1015 domain-containing protein [Gemmatimonadales bacterium]|jgi:uncharacterized protein (DUF1015 family)